MFFCKKAFFGIIIVFFFLMAKSIYHSLEISIYTFSSIIMIIFLLATSVKTKHWNQFVIVIFSPVFIYIVFKFCVTYMWSKPQCYKLYRSLRQLSIPEQPQNFISINFIEKLPLFSKFNTILIIINQLTKYAIFIPTQNIITSTDLVYLFILHMFSKYSVFSYITSNRGSEFVLKFFYSLDTTLNIQLYFT